MRVEWNNIGRANWSHCSSVVREGREDLSGLDHTLPTNTVYSPLDLGHPGVGNRRENKNGSVECRRICEIKSSEYMSWYTTLYT
jgi:hypothetical protein